MEGKGREEEEEEEEAYVCVSGSGRWRVKGPFDVRTTVTKPITLFF